jgi:UDP-N-acetylmuramyl pentapeptide phosphotransferase/UDP-N-acetylglucosamine-1-phosphate transferase
MNGMNLIDGMNGLFGFTAIFQLITLATLSAILYQNPPSITMIIFFIPLVLFMLFNFPFGKIFMGDAGAYLYGFINSLLVIEFFGKNENIYTWLAILILIYPCLELLFSYLRKVKQKFSPFEADNKHLHTLLYFFMNSIGVNKTYCNPLTTIILSPFWISPFLLISLVHFSLVGILLSILCICMIYTLSYLLLFRLKDDRL